MTKFTTDDLAAVAVRLLGHEASEEEINARWNARLWRDMAANPPVALQPVFAWAKGWGHPLVLAYRPDMGEWVYSGTHPTVRCDHAHKVPPTHWMPLPAPPV